MSLGRQIKKARTSIGISQDELSRRTGLSRVSIGNYERDSRTPKSDVLKKIAAALNTSTDYLLEKTPYYNTDSELYAAYNEYAPDYDFNPFLEEFLEAYGYQIYAGIFDCDLDDNNSKQAKIEEWMDPSKQYYIIKNGDISFKVTPEEAYNFEQNILFAIDFEWFKLLKSKFSE